MTFSKAYTTSFIESWSDLTTRVKKPIIAAVSGHALGGGCELAMMCDILYCTTSANFGQPEIRLGTIPGAGGSQRLARAIGKSRAMELILTGKSFSGAEAAQWGVAARAFETYEELMQATLKTAETIAGYSRVAVMGCKEVVNKSQDLPLRTASNTSGESSTAYSGARTKRSAWRPLLRSRSRSGHTSSNVRQ